MFVLAFNFPAGRYHATPWGRNVNEADVAWPPEPWRLLRALIATYWRKGNRTEWSDSDLALLINTLAETLPEFSLPAGVIHAHTRHYMPLGKLQKNQHKKTLVFDAFVHIPRGEEIVALWPKVTLDDNLFALAADLASSIGYLGRAESWTECRALKEWDGGSNCRCSADANGYLDYVHVIAALTPLMYQEERQRLLGLRIDASKPRRKKPKVDVLPERLMDAIALDTADYRSQGWSQPPSARQVTYVYPLNVAPSVITRKRAKKFAPAKRKDKPTVARFLLVGRPRPRIEDTIKIGELMRLAALSQFGWREDATKKRKIPQAPWQISGRGISGKPLRDRAHIHAFWLPEDADDDGWIDHISIFIAGGINGTIRTRLNRIKKLWIPLKNRTEKTETKVAIAKEWNLALEGYGELRDFGGSAGIFDKSTTWQSVTPFLASGHLRAGNYTREIRRLLKLRGLDTTDINITRLSSISVGGVERRPAHFYRFRSRGRERQPDKNGAFLQIRFKEPISGPIALGYGSHFGLGLFAPVKHGG